MSTDRDVMAENERLRANLRMLASGFIRAMALLVEVGATEEDLEPLRPWLYRAQALTSQSEGSEV